MAAKQRRGLLAMAWVAVAAVAAMTAMTAEMAAALGGCDPLVPAHCLLPFPNDFYTVQVRTRTSA